MISLRQGNDGTYTVSLAKKKPVNNLEWIALQTQAGHLPVIIQVRRDVWLYFVRLGVDEYHVWLMNPQGQIRNNKRILNGEELTKTIIKAKTKKA